MRSGALDTCHSLWSVSGSQQRINKISSLLCFTCHGSSLFPCCFLSPACTGPLTLPTTVRDEGAQVAGQWARESERIRERLQTQVQAKKRFSSARGKFQFRQTDKKKCPVSGRYLEGLENSYFVKF